MNSDKILSNEHIQENNIISNKLEINPNENKSLTYLKNSSRLNLESNVSILLPNKTKSFSVPDSPCLTFNQRLKNFMSKFIVHMVDEVCLYSEKIDYLEQIYSEMDENLFQSKEEKEIKLKAEKQHISIRSIESEFHGEETKIYKIIPVFSKNEENIDVGKYGWFFFFRFVLFHVKN